MSIHPLVSALRINNLFLEEHIWKKRNHDVFEKREEPKNKRTMNSPILDLQRMSSPSF
jgi:hypothetical protein